jgi:hypothetical protein
MLEMAERKEQQMPEQPPIHPSSTSVAVAAAHDAPLTAALDSVRWVRRGFLRRLKRDTVD